MSWKVLSDDYFEKTPVDDVHSVAWATMVLPSLPLAEVVSVDATAWYPRFNNRRPAGGSTAKEYEALQLLFQAYELAAVAKRETATAFADGLAENANAVSEVLSKRKLDDEEASPDPWPIKSCVQAADDGIIKVLEPGVVLSPDFGDFGDVVTRIKELQASSDTDRGHKLLYWRAFDFRSLEHKHPLPDNETGLELESGNMTLDLVDGLIGEKFKPRLVVQAGTLIRYASTSVTRETSTK